MHLESNAFAPVCPEDSFRTLCYLAGDEILADLNSENPIQPAEISGFVDEMNRLGVAWEPVPILVTASEPNGPCDQAFFDATLEEMRRRLSEAGPIDGVYFSAHGGMTATVCPDPDGDLLQMARDAVGPDVPLIATLDLHANVSHRMVTATDVLISYITNPHVDQKERACEAARAMADMFDGMKPQTAAIRLPITAPTVTLLSAKGPYADLINYGQKTMGEDILNVSVVAGFVFSDLAKNGMTVLVTARDDLAVARALAEDIATRAWAMRERFQTSLTSLQDAVDMAVKNGQDVSRPALILADVADNPGGGGRGNTAWILSALYEAGAQGVLFGVFNDPALVRAARDTGEGAEFQAVFNSETASEFSKRFEAPARVIALSNGECIGRRGLWAGRSLSLGPTALLQVGGIKVVVVTNRKQCAEPRFFEMFGLDIADARTVVVKSRGHFRAGFDEFFPDDRVIEVDVPGLTSPVLSRFDFKNLPRPTIPLDADATWDGPKW
ncbi:MAG: M81 family metallopeptidase [Rhodospirillales bacterium]|nr:M81 family metallopeptidase [Alphaproteobacteria bacterium]MBL6947351.1 M81 family metallopeptidase [Rhodospirillales bacterium]